MFGKKCVHDWKKQHDSYDKSPAERMQMAGITRASGLEPGAFCGTRIIILTCNKCGKIDKTVQNV